MKTARRINNYGIERTLQAAHSGVQMQTGTTDFYHPKKKINKNSPPVLEPNQGPSVLSSGQSGQDVTVATNLYLVQRLREVELLPLFTLHEFMASAWTTLYLPSHLPLPLQFRQPFHCNTFTITDYDDDDDKLVGRILKFYIPLTLFKIASRSFNLVFCNNNSANSAGKEDEPN